VRGQFGVRLGRVPPWPARRVGCFPRRARARPRDADRGGGPSRGPSPRCRSALDPRGAGAEHRARRRPLRGRARQRGRRSGGDAPPRPDEPLLPRSEPRRGRARRVRRGREHGDRRPPRRGVAPHHGRRAAAPFPAVGRGAGASPVARVPAVPRNAGRPPRRSPCALRSRHPDLRPLDAQRGLRPRRPRGDPRRHRSRHARAHQRISRADRAGGSARTRTGPLREARRSVPRGVLHRALRASAARDPRDPDRGRAPPVHDGIDAREGPGRDHQDARFLPGSRRAAGRDRAPGSRAVSPPCQNVAPPRHRSSPAGLPGP
jgi:hypothetical protein